MANIIKELADKALSRPSQLRKAKNEGKKIIQYTGNFVPEEMIYAVGAEPYLMCRGGEPEPTDAVLEYMLRFMNPLARSMVGFYKLGLDPVTPIADVTVAQQTDCHVGRISELMEFMELPVYKIGVPSDWKKDFAAEYYFKALYKFKDKLEELTGNEITDEKLKKYIGYTNRINKALSDIDELRKKDNPPISGYEFILLNHYSFFVDPEFAAEKLEELYNELKDAEGNIKKDSPRLLFAGHAVAVGDYTVPRLFESSGSIIAADMLDEGIRPYKWQIKTEGDLIRNIGENRYLDKTPLNIFQPAWEDRIKYMKELIKEYNIDGVVWYQLAFDEIYDMECSCIAKWLGEINVPFLKIESSYEYSREAMGPLTTRIESFIESVKEGK